MGLDTEHSNGMTELDYLLAQDLTRLRVAWVILSEIITMDPLEQMALMKGLDLIIKKHSKRIHIIHTEDKKRAH